MDQKTAVVITTYNNPRLLGICLESLFLQKDSAFDIYIADDGSGDETKNKIETFRAKFGSRLNHFWHPDRGYQKSVINNRVFEHLLDYQVVICIDHDVLLNEYFVYDHKNAHKNSNRVLFMGRRVDLGPEISSQISEANVYRFNHGLTWSLLRSQIRKDSRNVFRSVRITNSILRRILKRDEVPDLLGSNFSISRELLWEINGFNENLKSYWGEDGDLFVRAKNSGAEIFGSKSLAIQLHLWHKRLEPSKENQDWYQKILNDPNYTRCEEGIFKTPRPMA
jgi:glycosyltransferase involved in cell wall biosynthesis